MKLEGENVLLRIFIDTAQKWHHRPVYEVIVERAQSAHLAGATVLEAVEGFGQKGEVLAERRWHLSNPREVTVEVVDAADKIDGFLAAIEPMLQDAVVTLERAYIAFHRASGRGDERLVS